uniref:Ig-like domain-containing protein n=1 Tax=Erpetoichthys calabaricus TaxID=27687 RepID=A0A8C4TJB3_ERPCA
MGYFVILYSRGMETLIIRQFVRYDDVSLTVIKQNPLHLITTTGDTVTLSCAHDGGTSYPYMLWYQQPVGVPGLKLIAYLSYSKEPEYEDGFSKEKYEVIRQVATNGTLKINSLEPSDSAMYFCAASEHGDHNQTTPQTKTPSTKNLSGERGASIHWLCPLYFWHW